MVIKVFSSGTKRLLQPIERGNPVRITAVHTNQTNFLGYLKNTEQHIQLIKLLNNQITVPDEILSRFIDNNNDFINNIKQVINDCDVYIFEISSIKTFTVDGFQVSSPYERGAVYSNQLKDEFLESLDNLVKLIPIDKKIIFMTPIRSDVIYGVRPIAEQKIICEGLAEFVTDKNNITVCDPTTFIKKNPNYFDKNDGYFTQLGENRFFLNLYNNFMVDKEEN